ncbi:unnamed protein product [Paramecium sonneborni]|uniref:Transmembrane protein n=1 Tax=Paramecium sonneborni TaxID=65129 RepID=A0A8S1RKM8_9CILI|nr:unnamed protein product [Paramecium sonneborni]
MCDDCNTLGGDGCSSFCSIEDSFQCESQQGSISLCTSVQAPQFKLEILSNKENSIQVVEITFTQQVKLHEELILEDFMLFSILPQTQYVLTINSIQNLTINLTQPILNYFQIDQLLNKLRGSNVNLVNSKLNQDPSTILNQLYIYNAKSCYFSVFASILSYFICCLLVSKLLQKFIFNLNKKYETNKKILKMIHQFQHKIQKKCLILKIEYFSLGIFKVYQAILHQFLFSAILQFPNYTFDSLFEIFNSINAIIGLLFIIIATFPLLSITSSKIKNQRKWKYFYFESNSQFWVLQFKPFQIFRTLFYILIIVKLINFPEAQSILLSTQSFLFMIYLIKFKPLKSVYELSKLICRELLLMIITGTFLCYSFEFSPENNIIIGWVHIGMFCAILASNLFIDLLQQIKTIYEDYLKKKQKEKIEQEKKYIRVLSKLRGFQIMIKMRIQYNFPKFYYIKNQLFIYQKIIMFLLFNSNYLIRINQCLLSQVNSPKFTLQKFQ